VSFITVKAVALYAWLGPKGTGLVVLALLTILLISSFTGGSSSKPSNAGVERLIKKSGITPTGKFTTHGSTPQKDALNWILNDDPAKLNAKSSGILDRYALAVFYFSTKADQMPWTQMDGWMTEKGICEWYGIQCVPRPAEPTEANEFKNTITQYDDNDSITRMELVSNQIQGELPGELGGLSDLLTLDLQDNEIEGKMPANLAKATNLRALLLRKNRLVGKFPAFLTGVTSLHSLHLGENRFQGKIPDSVNNMKELRSLGLNENEFYGKIPNIGSLTNLVNLYLEDNDLSGTIPSYLPDFQELRKF